MFRRPPVIPASPLAPTPPILARSEGRRLSGVEHGGVRIPSPAASEREAPEIRDNPRGIALSALFDAVAAMKSAAKFKVLLKCLAQGTAQACDMQRCSIFLWKDDAFVPAVSMFASGIAEPALWRRFKALGPLRADAVPAFAQAKAEQRPVLVPEPLAGDLIHPEWATAFEARAILVVPLLHAERFIGVVALDRSAPISHDEIGRARTLADQLASAIDRAHSSRAIRAKLRAAETLLNVGRTIGSTLELQEVARLITREATRAVEADSGGIYILSMSSNLLVPYAAYRMPKHLLHGIRNEPIVLSDLQALATCWSDDAPNDPAFQFPILRKFPAQSLFVTALRAKDVVCGLLVCGWWKRRRRMTAEEVRLMEGIAAQAAMAVVNARLYAKAEQLAVDRERGRVDKVLHDTLSRTLFSVGLRIEQCLRRARRSSELRSLIEEIKRDTSLMMAQLRQLLAPSVDGVRAESFSERLGRLFQEFRELTGIAVMFIEHGNLSRLDRESRDVLAKIFEAALVNIATHVGVSRAELRLTVGADDVRFEVTDNGEGSPLDDEGDQAPGPVAFAKMRERIAAMGGSLQTCRELGIFRISGTFPLS